MLSTIRPPLADLVRTMQYMSAHNGGLIVDFRPIRRYAEIALEAPAGERVRTVLDWIAFATELGLLGAGTWRGAFEDAGDLVAFTNDLRAYDLPLDARHAAAFERLGVIYPGQVTDYAGLADTIGAAGLRREAA